MKLIQKLGRYRIQNTMNGKDLKMERRMFLKGVGVVAAGILAGCGSKPAPAKKPVKEKTTPPAEKPAAAPAEKPAAAPAAPAEKPAAAPAAPAAPAK
jgi:hypothetical protein